MHYKDTYRHWLSSPALSEEERGELRSLEGQDAEIEDRFFSPLVFGTAGLRGFMATGLRRMNIHVVRHTTQAFSNLILNEGADACARGVAIAYDCRHRSEEFARAAACVLAANGIHVRLFDELRPTPELSFAIRRHRCIAGINITASHNPKEYNGYKVYWSDGAQLPPHHADVVAREMAALDPLTGAKTMDFEDAQARGLVEWLGADTDEAFLSAALGESVAGTAVHDMADRFRVVFTPFHGAGYRLIPEVLRRAGFRHVYPVLEQMVVDGAFPTVPSPNPEDTKSFDMAILWAKEKDAHLIIGSDPDADRVGVLALGKSGEYIPFTGNQVGVLLLDYLIKARQSVGALPADPAVIQTIVSTRMTKAIAKAHNITYLETFTGFKFIAERINEREASGRGPCLLGFEESYGYLVGNFARDKDAVTASLLVAEMAAWHFREGRTLADALENLFLEYGYYMERTLNLVMPGLDGLAHMEALMAGLRDKTPADIAGARVLAKNDYLTGRRTDARSGAVSELLLADSNVLSFELEDGTTLLIRPSGTEPKVKVYILTVGASRADALATLERYTEWSLRLKE